MTNHGQLVATKRILSTEVIR